MDLISVLFLLFLYCSMKSITDRPDFCLFCFCFLFAMFVALWNPLLTDLISVPFLFLFFVFLLCFFVVPWNPLLTDLISVLFVFVFLFCCVSLLLHKIQYWRMSLLPFCRFAMFVAVHTERCNETEGHFLTHSDYTVLQPSFLHAPSLFTPLQALTSLHPLPPPPPPLPLSLPPLSRHLIPLSLSLLMISYYSTVSFD